MGEKQIAGAVEGREPWPWREVSMCVLSPEREREKEGGVEGGREMSAQGIRQGRYFHKPIYWENKRDFHEFLQPVGPKTGVLEVCSVASVEP